MTNNCSCRPVWMLLYYLYRFCIDYIAYFPFSTLQLFELLNTKFLLKMKKEEGEGRLDITEEDEEEAGEDEEEEEEQEEEPELATPIMCLNTMYKTLTRAAAIA